MNNLNNELTKKIALNLTEHLKENKLDVRCDEMGQDYSLFVNNLKDSNMELNIYVDSTMNCVEICTRFEVNKPISKEVYESLKVEFSKTSANLGQLWQLNHADDKDNLIYGVVVMKMVKFDDYNLDLIDEYLNNLANDKMILKLNEIKKEYM